MGSRLLVGQARHGAHQSFAVMAHAFRLCVQYHHQPVALTHGRSHTAFQPRIVLVGHHQLVDYDFHIVVLVAVQLHAWKCFLQFAVHADVEVTFLPHLLEQFLVVSLTVAHQRSKQIDALAFVLLQNEIQNLFLRIFHHLLAAEVRISLACPGIEQTQEVVYFGRGAHGRTRVLVRRLLFDGDDGAQARYLVHVRTLQITQEVAGIGRERLDVTPLSLGKDGVESQRRLAATAQPRDDCQAVSRNLCVDVLQVVYPGSVDIDIFVFFLHIRLHFIQLAKINVSWRISAGTALFSALEQHNIIS